MCVKKLLIKKQTLKNNLQTFKKRKLSTKLLSLLSVSLLCAVALGGMNIFKSARSEISSFTTTSFKKDSGSAEYNNLATFNYDNKSDFKSDVDTNTKHTTDSNIIYKDATNKSANNKEANNKDTTKNHDPNKLPINHPKVNSIHHQKSIKDDTLCFTDVNKAYEYMITQQKSRESGDYNSVSSNGVININTASEGELTTLKGIGSSKAQDIILYRSGFGRFKSADDLANVKGIGKKTIDKNRDRIIVE